MDRCFKIEDIEQENERIWSYMFDGDEYLMYKDGTIHIYHGRVGGFEMYTGDRREQMVNFFNKYVWRDKVNG